jgi:hypothetical protein
MRPTKLNAGALFDPAGVCGLGMPLVNREVVFCAAGILSATSESSRQAYTSTRLPIRNFTAVPTTGCPASCPYIL